MENSITSCRAARTSRITCSRGFSFFFFFSRRVWTHFSAEFEEKQQLTLREPSGWTFAGHRFGVGVGVNAPPRRDFKWRKCDIIAENCPVAQQRDLFSRVGFCVLWSREEFKATTTHTISWSAILIFPLFLLPVSSRRRRGIQVNPARGLARSGIAEQKQI